MRSRRSTSRRSSSSLLDKPKTHASSVLRGSVTPDESVMETAGEVFSDGTTIEILRDPASPARLSLVRSGQGVLDLKPTLSHAGRLYAPIRLESSVSKAVLFPTGCTGRIYKKAIQRGAFSPSPISRPTRSVHQCNGLRDFCVVDVSCFANGTDPIDLRSCRNSK